MLGENLMEGAWFWKAPEQYLWINAISMLCSNARAPVAQLVRASDWNSEDPGSNPGWISMSFFSIYLSICLSGLV